MCVSNVGHNVTVKTVLHLFGGVSEETIIYLDSLHKR